MRPSARALACVALAAGAIAALAAPGAADDPPARRLDAVQKELVRLQRELDGLATRERGLLGDVARLDAAIALDAARLEATTLELRATEDELARSQGDVQALEAAQRRRAPALAARVRELYKQGSSGLLARVLAPASATKGLDGVRYAAYLARHDAAQLEEWRDAAARLDAERAALARTRDRLEAQREEAGRSKQALERERSDRASLLARIRGDREQHAQAIGELESAAKELGRILDGLDASRPTALDVRKFRGLLTWPAEGPVTAGFGKVVHPKFKTEVPHPGLDIDAAEGAPFRSVFDGRVVYASPLHGYGLTAVVDHGNGVMSVYAHAGVLLVESGQDVAAGQELGRVGDSGSLRGPYLYFELRVAGKPDDPARWLRRR